MKEKEHSDNEINFENTKLMSAIEHIDKGNLRSLQRYLIHLGENLPIEHIYNSMVSRPNEIKQEIINQEELLTKLEEIWKQQP